MVPITGPSNVRRIRIIFPRSACNRDKLVQEITEEIGDIPDGVSVDCQHNNWMDGDGAFSVICLFAHQSSSNRDNALRIWAFVIMWVHKR